MQSLILSSKRLLETSDTLPFSVYSSIKNQHIINVPMIKPLLVCVLSGCKKLEGGNGTTCPAGNFVFLSNRRDVEIRNIAESAEYFALIIEFEFEDFDCFTQKEIKTEPFIQGEMDSVFLQTLQQFVEWSAFAPASLWPVRRQEILQLLYQQGYTQISSIVESPSLTHKLHNLISANIPDDLNSDSLSSKLAMSESTLRRKLRSEGTNLQAIKDHARLGHGLHLVQTSHASIGRIAEQCGYQSQSRFTDKFKQLFGVTPSELRKTRMHD